MIWPHFSANNQFNSHICSKRHSGGEKHFQIEFATHETALEQFLFSRDAFGCFTLM